MGRHKQIHFKDLTNEEIKNFPGIAAFVLFNDLLRKELKEFNKNVLK